MTTDVLLGQTRSINPAAELFRRHPLFAGGALCLLTLMVPTLFAMALEQRTFLDINVWIKPLKFQAALAMYLATLAWFADWLPPKVAASRWHRIFSMVVVLAVGAEVAWILGAAALGTASHFNDSSPAAAVLYALMGVLAVTLTTGSLVYGVAILRDRNSRLDPVFRRRPLRCRRLGADGLGARRRRLARRAFLRDPRDAFRSGVRAGCQPYASDQPWPLSRVGIRGAAYRAGRLCLHRRAVRTTVSRRALLKANRESSVPNCPRTRTSDAAESAAFPES
jgi:hypothetical protein